MWTGQTSGSDPTSSRSASTCPLGERACESTSARSQSPWPVATTSCCPGMQKPGLFYMRVPGAPSRTSAGGATAGGSSPATISSSSAGLGPHRLIGKECGWRRPRDPPVRLLWREKAVEAVLDFLKDTRVGCRAAVMATIGPREEGNLSEGEAGEREEAGPGPP